MCLDEEESSKRAVSFRGCIIGGEWICLEGV